jgi:hypothetical protein
MIGESRGIRGGRDHRLDRAAVAGPFSISVTCLGSDNLWRYNVLWARVGDGGSESQVVSSKGPPEQQRT